MMAGIPLSERYRVMKAVGFRCPHPIDHPEALLDLELPEPECGDRDLLVEVRAVSANPVDCWIRASSPAPSGSATVVGMDAAGVVRQVGKAVSNFKPGDRVWYSGSFQRQGCSSELHVVDERLAARMPETLDFARAAALPLTSITAWELLFERLAVGRSDLAGGSLLVLGAAGGVGSVLVQLAHTLTNLRVIGTASRQESVAWVKDMGADAVIDHGQLLAPQLHTLGVECVDFVVSLTQTHRNLPQIIDVLKPRGHFGLIDAPAPMDLRQFMTKNLSVHYEDMGMTTKTGPADEYTRHQRILQRIAGLVDRGALRSTMHGDARPINAENARDAHRRLEQGTSIGKIVLAGF